MVRGLGNGQASRPDLRGASTLGQGVKMQSKGIVRVLRDSGCKEIGRSIHAITFLSPNGTLVVISTPPPRRMPRGILKKLERMLGIKLR